VTCHGGEAGRAPHHAQREAGVLAKLVGVLAWGGVQQVPDRFEP
jgi:hypothetical protein